MSRLSARSYLTPTAWLVGGVVALIGSLFTAQAVNADEMAARERFESVADTTVLAIENDLTLATQTLIGIAALTTTDPELSPWEFAHYIELSHRPAGFLAWGTLDLGDGRAVVDRFHAPGLDVDWTGTDLSTKRDFRGTINSAVASGEPLASNLMSIQDLPTRSALMVLPVYHGGAVFAIANADLLPGGLPPTITDEAHVTLNQSTQLAARGVPTVNRRVAVANKQWTLTLTAVSPRLTASRYVLPVGFLITLGFTVLAILLTRTAVQRRRLRADVQENERINEAREQFIASVSHEIRTPLTAVVGYAEVLTGAWHDLDDGEKLAMMAQISEQSGEVSSLVADLLVGSRADISTLHLDLRPVMLLEVANRALGSIPSELSRQIDIHFDDDRAWLADPGRAAQIVRNLVVNALKYGGESVSIESRRLPGQIVLSVVDDGDGVPAPAIESIFQPFSSLSKDNQALPSVGLGLHVSAKLAGAMGGSVTYRRANGLTSFDLALPAALITDETVTVA